MCVLVDILSNTVSRAGRVEDGLSQLISVQIGLFDIPFLPLLENDDIPVNAQNAEDHVVNGLNDMDT